jgi:hypothetical protein
MYFGLSYGSAVLNRQGVLFFEMPVDKTLCYSIAHEKSNVKKILRRQYRTSDVRFPSHRKTGCTPLRRNN